jgi:hypothetical protein
MADDPVAAPPAAPNPEELAQLRAEQEALRKQAQESAERAKAWEQKYQSDMNQVAEWAKTAFNQQGQQAKPPEQPGDPDAIISRREMEAALMRQRDELSQQQARELANTLRLQRLQNQQRASSDPYYAKYKDEIEQALDQVDPRAAALPQAYGEAIAMAKARHFEEVLEDEVKRRTAPPLVDDEEGSTATPPAQAGAIYAPERSAPVAPASAATGRAVSLRKPKAPEPLTADEDYVRARMGIPLERWHKNKAAGDADFDPFGFGGRSKI